MGGHLETEQSEREHSPALPSYQPALLLVTFLAIGIFSDWLLDLSVFWYVLAAAISLSIWCWVWYAVPSQQKRNAIGTFCLGCAIVSTGAFLFHADWNWLNQNDIYCYSGEESRLVCIKGIINSEPRMMVADDSQKDMNAIPVEAKTRFEFAPTKIRNGDEWEPVSGNMELIVRGRLSSVQSGDLVKVFGRLVRIGGPTNPGQFDFQEYYRSQRTFATLHALRPESVQVEKRARLWPWTRALSSLRQRLNEVTWKYVSPDRAGLASAVLLGNRSQLSASRREQFLMTGTVHLLAISGLHVGILAGVFFFIYRIGLIRRNTFLWTTIGFVIFYAWLVEFRAPVTRASILIVLLCLGRLRGYSSLSFNWLATAAFCILAFNPSDLFQLGAQLSFLAVATITFGKDWIFWPQPTDPLQKLIAYSRPWHVRTTYWLGRKARAAVLVSGLIWLVAMPLVAYRFHLLAPVALVINPILLIPIALALYGGLGVLVFGEFSGVAGGACGAICDWNLGFIEAMITQANHWPLSHSWTAGPSLLSLVVFYLGVFLLAIFPTTRVSCRTFLLTVFAWVIFGWLVPSAIRDLDMKTASPLVCTFIDVGHGNSVFVQTPGGKNLLYDGGSFGSPAFGARNIASVLWNHEIEHIDAIVLSHADVDHYNAVPYLSERFSIGVVYVSPVMRDNESRSIQALFQSLEQHGIRIETLLVGDSLECPYSTVNVLGPPPFGTGSNDNSDSIVLEIEFEEKRILLTGDLEQNGLQLLLTQDARKCDVLMAPHHGSIHSHPEAIMQWAHPEYVVISASESKVGKDALKEYSANATVFRTGVHGAISVTIEGGRVEVDPFLKP